MKKSMGVLLLVLLAGFVFTGCKKDKDEEKDQNVVGRWGLIHTQSKTFRNGTLDHEVPAKDVSSGDMSYKIVEFKADNTYSVLFASGDEVNATYRIEGKKNSI